MTLRWIDLYCGEDPHPRRFDRMDTVLDYLRRVEPEQLLAVDEQRGGRCGEDDEHEHLDASPPDRFHAQLPREPDLAPRVASCLKHASHVRAQGAFTSLLVRVVAVIPARRLPNLAAPP